MKNLWIFDRNRIQILESLADCRAMGGCDLKERLRMNKTLLSYHLGMLKRKGFVEEAKDGRAKLYRLKKDKLPYVKKVLAVV